VDREGEEEMNFLDLKFFILFMWILVRIACIFIIFVIATISKFQIDQNDSLSFLKTSFIQAILAVIIVGILIIVLNKFKKVYLLKKLSGKNKS
jgi:membrane protein YdbS with pleckstrin-like domain